MNYSLLGIIISLLGIIAGAVMAMPDSVKDESENNQIANTRYPQKIGKKRIFGIIIIGICVVLIIILVVPFIQTPDRQIENFLKSKTNRISIINGEYKADGEIQILSAYNNKAGNSKFVKYSDAIILMPPYTSDVLIIPFQISLEITDGFGEKYLHIYLRQQEHNNYFIEFYLDGWLDVNNSKSTDGYYWRTWFDNELWTKDKDYNVYGYIAIPNFYNSEGLNGNRDLIFKELYISFSFDSIYEGSIYEGETFNTRYTTYKVNMLQ